MNELLVGRVIATESKPTTVDDFCFWTNSETILRTFDVIQVKHINNSITYGMITQIEHMTDAASMMTGYVSNDFGSLELEDNLQTIRLSMNKVSAVVLFNDKGLELPVIENSEVLKLDEEGIKIALGIDESSYPKSRSIPCGLYTAYDSIKVPIYLNSNFLIGPDGAHLNISGISGLAAKTSYATFLMRAIQEFSIENKSDIAFIMLNVKQNDLLSLHLPPKELSKENTEKYNKLGLSGTPFKNVKYFLPYEKNARGSYLSDNQAKEYLENGLGFQYKFIYQEDHDSVESIFSNIDDPTGTMSSINALIAQRTGVFANCKTWADVMSEINKMIEPEKDSSSKSKEIPIGSWRKYKRHFNNAISSKVFGTNIVESEPEVRLAEKLQTIQANEVFVVDVAKLDEGTQGFVFSQVINAVQKILLNDIDDGIELKNPPKKVVVFVDELNKYGGKDTPKDSLLLKQLLELSERGRSLGAVLFSVQQFKSGIHPRITGNCSTSAYGRTNPIEISNTIYRHLPGTFKNMLTRLKPGDYILEHPLFKTAMKIEFPEPSYLKQEL